MNLADKIKHRNDDLRGPGKKSAVKRGNLAPITALVHGQKVIDQQCGTFGHVSGATAVTEFAVLTTERYEMLSMKDVAAYTQEAILESIRLELFPRTLA